LVGEGKLRVATEEKVNPDFLRRVKSPTLLNPPFYAEGCEDYDNSENRQLGCLAGELFFDIKPNGDFWVCRDHPSKMPLHLPIQTSTRNTVGPTSATGVLAAAAPIHVTGCRRSLLQKRARENSASVEIYSNFPRPGLG
jgi:hypothetical protein